MIACPARSVVRRAERRACSAVALPVGVDRTPQAGAQFNADVGTPALRVHIVAIELYWETILFTTTCR